MLVPKMESTKKKGSFWQANMLVCVVPRFVRFSHHRLQDAVDQCNSLLLFVLALATWLESENREACCCCFKSIDIVQITWSRLLDNSVGMQSHIWMLYSLDHNIWWVLSLYASQDGCCGICCTIEVTFMPENDFAQGPSVETYCIRMGLEQLDCLKRNLK